MTGRNPKQRLVSLAVDEISLVDRPAIEEKFVVIKSEEPPMAEKILETQAPATGAPAVTTPAQPTPGAAVQAVTETEVAKAKMSPEMLANYKAAMKTLKDAMSSMSGDDAKKKPGVKKNLAKFEYAMTSAQARVGEIEPLIVEAEKAASPAMQGTALLAQSTIGKLHGALYDLEMFVSAMMQMADEDEADDDAQKAAKAAADAGVLSGSTPLTKKPGDGGGDAGVLSGQTPLTKMSDDHKAKVKAAVDKALAELQDLKNGIDPLFWNQLIPTNADGQPSGAPKQSDGKTPEEPAMGHAPYAAEQGAITKAVEAATAPLKKSLEEATKAAADAKAAAVDAQARAEKLEKATGVSKALPEGGTATPVKKGGFWTGLL